MKTLRPSNLMMARFHPPVYTTQVYQTNKVRPSSLAKFKAKQPGAQHKAALYAACLYDLDNGVEAGLPPSTRRCRPNIIRITIHN